MVNELTEAYRQANRWWKQYQRAVETRHRFPQRNRVWIKHCKRLALSAESRADQVLKAGAA